MCGCGEVCVQFYCREGFTKKAPVSKILKEGKEGTKYVGEEHSRQKEKPV